MVIDIVTLLPSTRTARRIGVAQFYVGVIRSKLDTIETFDTNNRAAFAAELDHLRRWMDAALPASLGGRDQATPLSTGDKPGAPSRPAPLIDQASSMVQSPTGRPWEVAAILDAFHLQLEIDRRTLWSSFWHRLFSPRPPPPPPPLKPPSAPAPATPFKPDEAALLATITEKFYGSWAFRAMGLAVAAAVALAVGGDLLIGEKAYNLRAELASTGEAAKTEIKDQKTAMLDSLKRDQDAAAKATADLKAEQATVQASVATFSAGLDDTRRQAVAALTKSLQQDLMSRTSDLSRTIERESDQAIAALRAVGTDKLAPLQRQLDDLSTAAREMQNRLAGVHIETFDQEVAKIRAELASWPDVRAKTDSISAASGRADVAARLADGFADSAKASAQAASKAVAELGNAAGSREHALGAIEAITAALEKRAADLARRLSDLEKLPALPPSDRLAGSIKLAGDAADAARVQSENARQAAAGASEAARSAASETAASRTARAELDKRITALEIRVAASAPPPPVPPLAPQPASPAADQPLGRPDWRRVQAALAARGLTVTIDGLKGRGTCSAIRLYQRSLGAGETGVLTPEQIPMLLGQPARPGIRLIDDGRCA